MRDQSPEAALERIVTGNNTNRTFWYDVDTLKRALQRLAQLEGRADESV